MRNSFSSRINTLSAIINKLKTLGTRSASTVGLMKQTVSIAAGHQNAVITLNNPDGLPMLYCAYISSPSSLTGETRLRASTDSNGSNQILLCNQNGIDGYVLDIYGTSVFMVSIVYDIPN